MRTGTVAPLLDPAFGFFIWAAHLLAVYIAAAIACALGLGTEPAGARSAFVTVLALVTVAAVAAVVLHAIRRYRGEREELDRRFRLAITIGGDALASVAIAWQLLAFLLVPVCA